MKSADLEIFKQKQQNDQRHVETDFFKGRNQKATKSENEEEEEEATDYMQGASITSEEEAKKYRKKAHIKVTGEDVPLPVGNFNDLVERFEMDPLIVRNLQRMKFEVPTAIQSEAMPILLHGRDLLACAPTGSGKTLGFALPLIVNIAKKQPLTHIKGIIVSPTKELAKQIHNEIIQLSTGLNVKSMLLSKTEANKLASGAKIKCNLLVSTPLRLVEMVKAGFLDLSYVEYVVFDEADKLFEQGFVQQTDEILSFCTATRVQKTLFSATIPSGVEELAKSVMGDIGALRVIVGHKEAASQDIEQRLIYTGNEYGKLVAIRQMIADDKSGFTPPVLIFVQSIERAKALYHELLYDKVNVDAIHGERSQRQREHVIERFKQGAVWVLICTDVLARGIDFKGVNLVINYDVPPSAQSYVHRIGRTGRAGRKGKAVTFFTKEDNVTVKAVINVMKQSGCDVGDWMIQMEGMKHRHQRKLKHKPQARENISTVPKVFQHKKRQHREMIEGSKRRKIAAAQTDANQS